MFSEVMREGDVAFAVSDEPGDNDISTNSHIETTMLSWRYTYRVNAYVYLVPDVAFERAEWLRRIRRKEKEREGSGAELWLG